MSSTPTVTPRVAIAFNGNQFRSAADWTADLEARIDGASVVLIQESVRFDLARFAATHKGWSAHQLDAGENNGHANTAVLYRTNLGPVQDTICLFVGRARDKGRVTRSRYLIGIKLQGVWYVSLHVFPKRNRNLIAAQLKVAGTWAREHESEPQVWGLDRNQVTPATLQAATGLTWHGGTKDPMGGLLTNLKVSKPHEFEKGHSDHLGYAATVAVPAAKPPARVFHTSRPQFVGESPNVMHDANGTPWSNFPLTRTVIHCTVSKCVEGGRFVVARMFMNRALVASAHYVADPAGIVQVVEDHLVAEHAPPNPGSLGFELCDALVSEAWDKANAGRWGDARHQSMLHHVARQVALEHVKHHLPADWLTVVQLKAGKHGMCGHVDVSDAWHESDHWDPGTTFPKDEFVGMVARRMAHLTAA